MNILDGITSILGGGITGIIGSAVSSVYAYKSKQLDVQLQKDKYTSEIAMKEADAKISQMEWAARTQVADITASAAVETEDSRAFAAAQAAEPQKYASGALTAGQNWLMVVLDLFRGIIRPSLTVYLSVLTTVIYWQARQMLGAGFSAEQAAGLVAKIIDTVLYLTSTVVLFWFGTRVHDKKGK
jgi:hypothetical protein